MVNGHGSKNMWRFEELDGVFTINDGRKTY